MLDVLFDDLIGDVTATAAEIATRPNIPSPIRTPQMLERLQQLVRTLSLRPLLESADRQLWRNRYEEIHVIRRNIPP